MTQRKPRRRLRPDWWVIGPYVFNFVLWAVIVWGAHAIAVRAGPPPAVVIADLAAQKPAP